MYKLLVFLAVVYTVSAASMDLSNPHHRVKRQFDFMKMFEGGIETFENTLNGFMGGADHNGATKPASDAVDKASKEAEKAAKDAPTPK